MGNLCARAIPLDEWLTQRAPEILPEGRRALVFPVDRSGWGVDLDTLEDQLVGVREESEPLETSVGDPVAEDGWKLMPGEYEETLDLGPWERYAYFLERVAEWRVLWTLRAADTLAVGGPEQGPHEVAVWPHPRFARAAAAEEWEGYEPDAVTLEDWRNDWAARLVDAAIDEAIAFRVPGRESVVVSLGRLRQELARQRIQPSGRRLDPHVDDELTYERLYADGSALDAAEAAQALALDNAERYEFFADVVSYWGVLWLLADDEGVATATGERDFVPLWPHPDFARAAATDAWAGYEPRAVSVDDFEARGAGQELDLAVFPSPTNLAVVCSPEELASDLRVRCSG